MSSILYGKQFAELESSIHESTYTLLMHMNQMDRRIDNAMKEFELRKRALIKSRKAMHTVCMSTCVTDDKPPLEPESRPLLDPDLDTGTLNVPKMVFGAIRSLPIRTIPRYVAALTFAALAAPTAAMDHQVVLGSVPFVFSEAVDPHQVPRVTIGTCAGMVFLWGGYFMGAAKSVVGPLMGFTSVLYMMMRNDDAVKPVLAWAVLGVWSVFALMYLTLQSRRVAYNRIYMLVSLGFAGLCLCVVALVQKSSIQGGLVTAIPPCASFAAYAVAFAFPDRPRGMQQRAMV